MKFIIFSFILLLSINGISQEKVSDDSMVMYKGQLIGSEDEFSVMILDDKVVNFILFENLISFNIVNKEVAKINGEDAIVYDVEKNQNTLEVLNFEKFLIHDISKMGSQKKLEYTFGIESDKKYVLEITGDPSLRFIVNKITSNY